MAEKVISTTFQLRRGLKETWERNNPVLAYGEPGFEKDTYKLKIGDGVRDWISLPYIAGGGGYEISADEKSITIANDTLALYGFASAAAGQYPVKANDGTLTWVNPDRPLTEAEILEVIDKGE